MYSYLKQASSWIIMALCMWKKDPLFLGGVRYQRIGHVRSHENLWITQLLGRAARRLTGCKGAFASWCFPIVSLGRTSHLSLVASSPGITPTDILWRGALAKLPTKRACHSSQGQHRLSLRGVLGREPRAPFCAKRAKNMISDDGFT